MHPAAARNDLQLVGRRRGERGVELHDGVTLGIEIHLRHVLSKKRHEVVHEQRVSNHRIKNGIKNGGRGGAGVRGGGRGERNKLLVGEGCIVCKT